MSIHNLTRFTSFVVILLMALLLVLMAIALREMSESNKDLRVRVDRLERQKQYQGKDANGEEVWAAMVTEVDLKDILKDSK